MLSLRLLPMNMEATLVPEEVYAAGHEVQTPKWQVWAQAAKAKLDALLGAVA